MKKTARILFVGNSFTRIGDLPGMLTTMLNSSSADERYEAQTSLSDGQGFHWHWFHGDARQKIEALGHDFVVLQGSSLSVYPNPMNAQEGYTPEAMATYAGRFIELARRQGSQPILFAPQAASGRPEDLRAVIENYVEVALTFDVPVALCGAAWERAHRQQPELRLDVGDGYCHQNRQGLYLNACVFYGLFTGRSPEGCWPLSTPRHEGAKPRPAGPRDEPTARLLERIAWETVQEYGARGDVRVYVRRPD